MTSKAIPKEFIWRRLHSLTGLWLVGFLILHLLTNSQAALWVGEDGHGFINAVNSINDLPYREALEIFLIAMPFLTHMYLGIIYLFTGKWNSFPTDGSKPSLPEYPRNQAYTWQRITSWILLFLITGHVIQMRFYDRPIESQVGAKKDYYMPVYDDPGVHPLAERLDFALYTPEQVKREIAVLEATLPPLSSEETPEALLQNQEHYQRQERMEALAAFPLQKGELLTQSLSFGTAELLMLRDVFKSPIMVALYTVLVLSACFHAFNGLWTFMITWGVTLSQRSQWGMRLFAYGLMLLIAFLGLAAVWGTYWINLKQ